jgi:hypothetical protein
MNKKFVHQLVFFSNTNGFLNKNTTNNNILTLNKTTTKNHVDSGRLYRKASAYIGSEDQMRNQERNKYLSRLAYGERKLGN